MTSSPLTRRLPHALRTELARTDPTAQTGSGAQPARPDFAPHPDLRFVRGRVHEICGAARRVLALWLAGVTGEPFIWIAPAHGTDQLTPMGMADMVDPAQALLVTPRRTDDLLACTEEALRSGAVPLVVCELPAPPPLTPVRRLHLAATEGGEVGRLPLGLLLTPGDGGAPGVETRWHMAPTCDTTRPHPQHTPQPGWRIERRRARTQPPRAWSARRPQGQLSLTPCSA